MLANNKVTKICEVCRDNKGVATRVSIGRQMSYKFSDEKEYIRNDEENRIRRQLIGENKLKQNECNESDNSVDITSDNNSELVLHNDFLHDIIANTFELSDEDLKYQISEIESYVTNDTELHESSDENELSLDRLMEKSHAFAIKPVFRELTDYNGLNQLEFSRISELLSATTILKSSTTNNFVEITDSNQLMAYMRVKYEQQFRKLVNFTKMLNSFTTACPDDQYSLAKNSCTEMLWLRFFTYFNDDNNSLLTAIILFNPNRPNLTHRRYVQLEQQLS
ncbi:unnamed protein product [Oppiella nova]|uniref:NR LBD domain-containing protein n=1 Tax=Oppiella nova TaxID=334625 RepID=A0A7R9LUS2_9ACAR|nr:unnamed protein product [Oppiella nova]CAG2166425.1 unnamed protein product [Oppiella nova]